MSATEEAASSPGALHTGASRTGAGECHNEGKIDADASLVGRELDLEIEHLRRSWALWPR
jgi:hypothetical protein